MYEMSISNIQMFFGLMAVIGLFLAPLYTMTFFHGRKITELCVKTAVQKNQYDNDHPHHLEDK